MAKRQHRLRNYLLAIIISPCIVFAGLSAIIHVPMPTPTPTAVQHELAPIVPTVTDTSVPPTDVPTAADEPIDTDIPTLADTATARINGTSVPTIAGRSTVAVPASTSAGIATASHPAGATALCWDGTYYYQASHRGACSHHQGVETWYP